MDSECRLRNCLEDLGKRNHIAGLTLEANGSAGIEINDGRKIFIQLDRKRDRVYVYQPLLPWHASDAAMLQRSMELNLLEAATDGGVLSISQAMNAIVYHTSIEGSQIDSTRLQHTMEGLLKKGVKMTNLLTQSI